VALMKRRRASRINGGQRTDAQVVSRSSYGWRSKGRGILRIRWQYIREYNVGSRCWRSIDTRLSGSRLRDSGKRAMCSAPVELRAGDNGFRGKCSAEASYEVAKHAMHKNEAWCR
jgi:hypothetical protein